METFCTGYDRYIEAGSIHQSRFIHLLEFLAAYMELYGRCSFTTQFSGAVFILYACNAARVYKT